MICPYCESELEHEDVFGRIASHQDGKVLGDIYRCPLALQEEDKCFSESFHVCGSFYTYRDYNTLHEGYPC